MAKRRRYYSGGYMGQKRRELVRRVGYDDKNAAHLIRLLRMGIEFLTEGTIYVERANLIFVGAALRGRPPPPLALVIHKKHTVISTRGGHGVRPLPRFWHLLNERSGSFLPRPGKIRCPWLLL